MNAFTPNQNHLGGTASDVVTAWRTQLSNFASDFAASRLARSRPALSLSFSDDAIALDWTDDTRTNRLIDFARDTPDLARSIRAALSALSEKIGGTRDVSLSIAQTEVLRPSVRLPRAPRRVLRSALQYELERLSPVAPDELYFDFEIVGRDSESNLLEVELRVIRRAIVDTAVKLCHTAGLAISEIRFGDDMKSADAQSFPVDRNAFFRMRWAQWNHLLLAALACLLLVAVVMSAYLRGAAELNALADDVVSTGVRAARVERLRQRIALTTTQMSFLDGQRRAPMFVSILSDVAHALPDGTWITELDMAERKIRIVGYSHAASDLIGAFDRSGRFTNAQFAAPVTQGPNKDIERFDLTFDVLARK